MRYRSFLHFGRETMKRYLERKVMFVRYCNNF
nr:MAG TPA: hypothetical protein [Caudoviricetes sp.]